MTIINSCRNKERLISHKDIISIKKKYSKEAINYLYESCYMASNEQVKNKIIKWEDDITIFMQGEIYEKDSLLVDYVIRQIDSLDLPISAKLTNDSTMSNLQIYFGDFKYLDSIIGEEENDYRGTCHLSQHDNCFKDCKIGILNSNLTELSEEGRLIDRRSTILHEFIHALGFAAHRNEYNSVLFNIAYFRSLSKLDKEAIKLLYDPKTPKGYSKAQFENDFGDVLHRYQTPKKIYAYCKTQNIDPDILEYIVLHNYTDTIITKFPSTVFIKLYSASQKDDSIKILKSIKYINDNINGVSLIFYPKDEINRLPLIDLNIIEDNLLEKEKGFDLKIKKSKDFYPFRIYSNSTLIFKNDSLLDDLFFNENVLTLLANVLGIDSFGKDTLVQKIDADSIVLKQKYLDLLNLLYNPVVPNGMKTEDLQAVIDSLKENRN